MRLEVKDRGGAALAAAVKHAQDNQSSFGALELRYEKTAEDSVGSLSPVFAREVVLFRTAS